jgi:glucose-6-phosphate isomerase
VFDFGLPITLEGSSLRFRFGTDIFAPEAELRALDAIRPSLLDPACKGPDPVYGICMDVGRMGDAGELERRSLLFGVVAFAEGSLGREPVRTQGHVHARAPHSGWSPPELFEIGQGRAIIYAQEHSGDDPGRCFAVVAEAGEHVIVPPGWAHLVVNADQRERMVFIALCERQYGFEYAEVRARRGLAWFPVWEGGAISWLANPSYTPSTLTVGSPREYADFGVRSGVPLYTQFTANPDALQWVSQPALMSAHWPHFNPLGRVETVLQSTRT